MSYFLLDAFIRFFIALLLIPIIIYVYTKVSLYSTTNYSIIGQFIHFVYIIFLIFLTDDLFFKFMYLRHEYKEFLVQQEHFLEQQDNFFVIL